MQRGAVNDDDPCGAIEIQIVGNFDDRIGRQRDLLARAVVAAGGPPAAAHLAIGAPLSITPATSAAGENGNGGLIWYLPWIIRRSKKFSAADLIAITASPGPATGSGTSVSTRSSGPQYCEQRTAFMDTPAFRTLDGGWDASCRI